MRSARGVVATALSVGLVWSCASVPATDLVVGCYQFERNSGARTLGLPWGVELEAAPVGAGWPLIADLEGVRRARTATSPTGRADHPFGYWHLTPADSLEIGYPGGGGIVLSLIRQGQDLIGEGIAAGDVLPFGAPLGRRTPAPVVARRVLCGES